MNEVKAISKQSINNSWFCNYQILNEKNVFQFSAKRGCFLKKVIAVNIAVRAPGPGRRRRNKILDIRYVTGLAISYSFLVSLHSEYMRYIAYTNE
jgi:hypothetical protein